MPDTVNLLDVLTEAGFDLDRRPPSEETLSKISELIRRAEKDPKSVVVNLLRAEQETSRSKRNCAKAAAAAEELEQMLKDLLKNNAMLYRLETVREDATGLKAVCRVGNHIEEYPLHPELDEELLQAVQPWEYVCVSEKIVVNVWRDDPYLLDSAHGDVVDFKSYADRERQLVRVARNGQEEVTTLAGPLREEELTGGSKLVLQRGNSRFAIASVPASPPESRFEVPVERISTTLHDLACMEPVAQTLVMDIIKRILFAEIREQYALKPLRGMLLLSYKPGMGKTAFMRAFARWLHDLGQQLGFDVALYIVPPNSTKSMWHGEDARIVREDLFGAIRARRDLPRERVLFQFVVMDEIDALGRRPEAQERTVSAAQSDAVQAFLAEMDGMLQDAPADPPAHLLVAGMSNRPDLIDIATKRPGRMGDLVVEMPDLDQAGAEKICAIYARGEEIPFQLNGKPASGANPDDVLARLIRPAVSQVFPAVVLRYATDMQRKFDVTAGQILVGTHYEAAMNNAKNRAADRRVLGTGSPAIGYHDVVESLMEVALSVAGAMEADPLMLVRELQIKLPVASVNVVPREELELYDYLAENFD